MSRVARNSILTKVLPLGLATIVVAIGLIFSTNYDRPFSVTTTSDKNHNAQQTTDVKYKGVEGKTALELLRNYASIQTKHYSFGDQVIAINGTPGTGPKFWSFYVNGKLAEVGAGTYKTHNSDNIEWKLQQL